ncbi:hypothetical protein SCHPADRAFT_902610 [Schizopora paradoxa]|uniref:Uncharacterized protein n=1 Tax=Schizopora paradoxa TaxID=27342 RepID=A0A0H2RTK3_9AGAM|nr:hypothetical protein SCHPADRAFT_902610 [Schizopora paradoxa]
MMKVFNVVAIAATLLATFVAAAPVPGTELACRGLPESRDVAKEPRDSDIVCGICGCF